MRLLEGGRPQGPPLQRRRGKPGRRVQEAAPYKRGGGRTMCAPTWRGGGNLPPHPPQCAHWGTFPPGGRLRKNKKGQVLTCPLKHRGETQFRTKFLCFLSFSKKGSYTGPWRKRSIISWVREMADPPWGRFSRSNQVPSPSSSSWRVTVSSSVSRSQ